MELAVVVVVFGAICVVPLVGLILFLRWRSNAREAKLAGPWTALAEQWGGAYASRRIHCDRGDHRLTVSMELVSVMQAASGPYYPDGGTFTKLSLTFASTGSVQISDHGGALVDSQELAKFAPIAAQLPLVARVVLSQYEAVVVLPGAVSDLPLLDQCIRTLMAIGELARDTGPIPVRAAN